MKKLILAALGLTAALASQPASAQTDTWRPGDPTIPYSEWTFPEVPYGTVWIPEIKYETRTTIIPAYRNWLREDAFAGAIDPQSLRSAGKGKEAIALIDRILADPSQAERHPYALYTAWWIHRNGTADLKADARKGIPYLQRLADQYPEFYQYLGDIYENGGQKLKPNKKIAAHYYSKGLSRGCRWCTSPLSLILNASTQKQFGVSDGYAAQFYIRFFGADIGYPALDFQVLSYWSKRMPEDVQQIWRMAHSFSRDYDDPIGASAIAIKSHMRTGLVPEQHVWTFERIQQFGGATSATGYFNMGNQYGRYAGYLANLLLTTPPKSEKDAIQESVQNAFILIAASNGELEWTMAAAAVYANEAPVVQLHREVDGLFQVERKTSYFPFVKSLTETAQKAGFGDPALIELLLKRSSQRWAEICWSTRHGHGTGTVLPPSDDRGFMEWFERKKKECFERDAIAVAYGGQPAVASQPDWMKRAKTRGIAMAREQQAQAERDRLRIARERQAYADSARSSGSAWSSYGGISAGTSRASVGTGTISSAQAHKNAKRNLCATGGGYYKSACQ